MDITPYRLWKEQNPSLVRFIIVTNDLDANRLLAQTMLGNNKDQAFRWKAAFAF